MKSVLTLSLAFLTSLSYGEARKPYYPMSTYHHNNANMYGVSAGVSDIFFQNQNTNTYGIRLSLLGEGIFAFAIPSSPILANDSEFEVWKDEVVSHKITGVNLSASGSMCNCNINGVSAGFVAQLVDEVNGFSATGMMNFAQVHNGIQLTGHYNGAYKMRGLQIAVGANLAQVQNGVQIAGYHNEANKMRGLQIGGWNRSKDTRGVQIGLWNINERRKMPFINWNFRGKSSPSV